METPAIDLKEKLSSSSSSSSNAEDNKSLPPPIINPPITPIATVSSCYRTKFGIPRQPGLVSSAVGEIIMLPPYNQREAFRGIEAFSHIWVTFLFHLTQRSTWSPLVRPPRLGGNVKVGVFGTRATHRPNSIGLSVVRLLGVDSSPGRVALRVSGLDLVDGTPVLDIKPYLPYADIVPEATSGFAPIPPPPKLAVMFSPSVQAKLTDMLIRRPHFQSLVEQILMVFNI